MGAHASHESRQTSLLAYAEIAPSLSQRESDIFDAVIRYGKGLTVRELFEAMKARGVVSDRGEIFPRISSMVDKGVLRYGPVRKDRYSGRSAHVLEVG